MKNIIIVNDELKCNMNNIMNIEIDICTKCIIKGTVYSDNCKYSENAVVQLIERNERTNKERILGMVTTDEKGEYYFTVSPSYNMVYKINVFPMSCAGERL